MPPGTSRGAAAGAAAGCAWAAVARASHEHVTPNNAERLHFTRSAVYLLLYAVRPRRFVVPDRAELLLDGKKIELPTLVGSENEKAVDIRKLRGDTGYVVLDPAFMNTASVTS